MAKITAEAQVQSPAQCSGLRIWHCGSCGIDCSCGSDSFPGLGASICHRYSQKKKKKVFIKYFLSYSYNKLFSFLYILITLNFCYHSSLFSFAYVFVLYLSFHLDCRLLKGICIFFFLCIFQWLTYI